ncbi:hypothetical protein ECTW15901_4147, partial [Escherichia coli TW15901]
VLQTKLILMNK